MHIVNLRETLKIWILISSNACEQPPFWLLGIATHYHSHLRLCGSQSAKLEVVMCHGNACCRIDGFLQAASLGSRARSTYWDTWNDHELQLLIFLQSLSNNLRGPGFALCNDHYMSLRPSDCRLGHFPRPHMSLSHMVPTTLHIHHPQRSDIRRGSLFPPFEHCCLLFRLFGFRCAGVVNWLTGSGEFWTKGSDRKMQGYEQMIISAGVRLCRRKYR